MVRPQLTLPCATAALALSTLFLPVHARAASDGCAVVGMLDARAKALCEAAARSERATPAQNRGPAYGPPPPPAYGPAPSSPAGPLPAVRPGFTRVNVMGNLYVDVQGSYPDGYAGRWSSAPTSVPVNQTWYVNRGETRSTMQQTASLSASDGSGRAQLSFAHRVGTCYGDLAGANGQVLLTEAPRTFQLTNLHVMSPNYISGCAFTNTINNFSGSVTLSADNMGNVYVQYAVNVFNAQGVQQYLWESSSYQLRNTMTPEMAVADIAKKKQMATQQAAADVRRQESEAAAAQQSAQAAADRKRSEDLLANLPSARGGK